MANVFVIKAVATKAKQVAVQGTKFVSGTVESRARANSRHN